MDVHRYSLKLENIFSRTFLATALGPAQLRDENGNGLMIWTHPIRWILPNHDDATLPASTPYDLQIVAAVYESLPICQGCTPRCLCTVAEFESHAIIAMSLASAVDSRDSAENYTI